MSNQIITTIETITPAIAEIYLQTNAKNQRNVTLTHVSHLSQQMSNGQWMMTGEPIIFDNQGKLIDGQHRLKALILSGKSLDFIITRGIPSESFVAINRGKSRTNANIFAIKGVSNYNVVASATTGVLNYRRALLTVKTNADGSFGGYGSLNSHIRPSSADVVAEYDKHPIEYNAAVSFTVPTRKLLSGSVVSTVSALALIDAKRTMGEVDYFWEKLRTGAELSSDDSILMLKNRLQQNDKSKAKLPQYLLTMLVIKAWNYYVQCKPCKVLRVIEGEGVSKIL